jgi:hypothetical protein
VQLNWKAISADLVKTATDPATPVRGRKNMYALKNWIAKAAKAEDIESVPPLLVRDAEEEAEV